MSKTKTQVLVSPGTKRDNHAKLGKKEARTIQLIGIGQCLNEFRFRESFSGSRDVGTTYLVLFLIVAKQSNSWILAQLGDRKTKVGRQFKDLVDHRGDLPPKRDPDAK